MAKMRTMQHNSRANSKGRVHGTKHNDRDFDTGLADNINQEKSKDNVYWHLYQEQDPGMTFTEAELKFYVETFGEQLQKTNDNYLRQCHPERCKDMETWKMARQNAPEETVTQIGKMEDHVSADKLLECFLDYNGMLESWNQEHGRPFTTLTWALHTDEAVPHIQRRKVWHYQDAQGMTKVGQEKALAQAGVPLPKPDKPVSRTNNRKITFDKMCREMWLEVLQNHGLDIEDIPVPDGKHNREKEDMIRDKYQKISDETERLQEQKEDLTTQLQEKNLEYNKAVGQEIEQRMEQQPAQIERKPVPFTSDKVIVSVQDLDDLERRAVLNTAHKKTLEAAEAQLIAKTKNVDTYIDDQVALLRAHLERELAAAQDQKKKQENATKVAQAERAAASREKIRYHELYQGQLAINQALQAEKEKNAEFEYRLSALSQTYIELRDRKMPDKIKEAVAATKRPLQEKIDEKDAEISRLNDKISEKDAEISGLNNKISEKDTEISGINAIAESLQRKIEDLQERLREAYNVLANAIKAVALFKWGEGNYKEYRIKEWTPKQDRLLTAIMNYSAWWARKDGSEKNAKDIETRMGINSAVKEFLPSGPQHKKEDWGD